MKHVTEWILMPENLGERCSIDETQLCEDVYTMLSNKEGHGGKGSVIAIVRGTRADAVSKIAKQTQPDELAKVKEITMDFSVSMYNIARQCFPEATFVIDCFHILKRLCEGLEEMRLKFKRLAVTENKKQAVAHAKAEEQKAKRRAYYRRTHKRNPREKKGRKRLRRIPY